MTHPHLKINEEMGPAYNAAVSLLTAVQSFLIKQKEGLLQTLA